MTLSNSRFANTTGLALMFSHGNADIDQTQFVNGGPARFANCTKVRIRNSLFSGNTGTGGYPAGALSLSCPVEIDDTQFANNKGVIGGAIEFTPAADSATLEGVTFTGNIATKSGGAIGFDPNNASPRAIDIRYGVFKNNTAPIGGALDLGEDGMNATVFTGYAVQFVGNQATVSGGGLSGFDASVTLSRAVFANNTAVQQGGAVFLRRSSKPGAAQPADTIANALIVKNTAQSGSAISDSDVLVVNSTIADNQGEALSFATSSKAAASWQQMALKNTIVSNNANGNCQAASADLGTIADAGSNLQFPDQSCGTSIKLASPILDTLYDPVIGSPALGAGDIAACLGNAVHAIDVFGQARPQHGPNCSIGAVEGDIDRPVDTAQHNR